MTRILYAGDIKSGTTGATTYTTNGVLKRKSLPRTRRTPRSVGPRSSFGYLSRKWGFLNAENKELWRAYGIQYPVPDVFGNPMTLNGMQSFIRLNQVAIPLGVTLQQAPPTVGLANALATMVLTDGPASAQITATVTTEEVGDADDFIEFGLSTAIQGNGIAQYDGSYHRVIVNAGNVLTADVPTPGPGMIYFIRSRYVDQFGQKSVWLEDSHESPTVI